MDRDYLTGKYTEKNLSPNRKNKSNSVIMVVKIWETINSKQNKTLKEMLTCLYDKIFTNAATFL